MEYILFDKTFLRDELNLYEKGILEKLNCSCITVEWIKRNMNIPLGKFEIYYKKLIMYENLCNDEEKIISIFKGIPFEIIEDFFRIEIYFLIRINDKNTKRFSHAVEDSKNAMELYYGRYNPRFKRIMEIPKKINHRKIVDEMDYESDEDLQSTLDVLYKKFLPRLKQTKYIKKRINLKKLASPDMNKLIKETEFLDLFD